MRKILVIVVAIAVLAFLVVWLVFRSPEKASSPAATPEVLGGDTTSAIQEDLNSLDLGDLDAEFEAIDADLNQL